MPHGKYWAGSDIKPLGCSREASVIGLSYDLLAIGLFLYSECPRRALDLMVRLLP